MEEAEELRGRGDDDEKETTETQSTQRPTQRKIGGIKPKA